MVVIKKKKNSDETERLRPFSSGGEAPVFRGRRENRQLGQLQPLQQQVDIKTRRERGDRIYGADSSKRATVAVMIRYPRSNDRRMTMRVGRGRWGRKLGFNRWEGV